MGLNLVTGISVSPAQDQGFIIHFQNGKDLLCYMITPQFENRVAEMVAILCQICQRSEFVCIAIGQLCMCMYLFIVTFTIAKTLGWN